MKHEVDSQHAVEGVTGRCPANCDVTPRQWSNSRHGHACALFHHLRLRTRPDGPRMQKKRKDLRMCSLQLQLQYVTTDTVFTIQFWFEVY